MAELEMDDKNQISHRARALETIRPVLEARLGLSEA
jgi:inosine/xanthosine triphosphate pyrophosphatase family protein